jgi:hypothetical protein
MGSLLGPMTAWMMLMMVFMLSLPCQPGLARSV